MDWNGNGAWNWDASCTGPTANIIPEEDGYVPLYDGGAIEGQPDGVTWYAPANFHISTAENDRERTGFTTSLQWANTDETITATLEHINSKASLEYRERVIASGDQGFKAYNGGAVQWTADEANGRPITVDGNGFLTSGIGRNTEAELPLQFRSRFNYNENTVEDTSFNLTFKPTDRLTASFDYQRVESEQIVHNYGLTSRINGNQTSVNAPFYMDLRGSNPTIEFLNSNTSYPTNVALPAPHNGLDANGDVRVDNQGNPILGANGQPVPGVTYTNPILRLASGMQQEVHAIAESDSVKFDVQYDLDGVFTAIKAGVYYSDKELSMGDTEYEGWQALGTPWSAEGSYNASPQAAAYLYERISFADQYNGKVVMGDNNSFLFPKMDLAKNYVQTLREGCGSWSAPGNAMGVTKPGAGNCAVPYEDLADRVDGHFAPRHLSSTNEERTEFYVRGDFAFDDLAMPIKGNVGLRYVSYQLESTGNLTMPAESRRGTDVDGSLYQVMSEKYPSIFELASGDAIQSTIKGTDYDTVLPSLNVSLSVTDDVVVRFGASKGLYFPSLLDTRNSMVVTLDYDEVLQDPTAGKDDTPTSSTYNPVVDLENIEISANARNAFLEPEESVNFDLTTEWYFAQAGSLSVGLFHKKLENIIRNKQFDAEIEIDSGTYPISAYGPANTGSGTIRGVEFSYSQFYDMLPGAWSGLGLQFNYTYIDQSGLEDPNDISSDIRYNGAGVPISDNRNSFRAFSGLPLQGYSDQNLNIVGMYEYNDISFRLAYTWRSEYLLTLRESEEFVPAYAKAQGMMDASLYYTINDSWKVGIEGSNLLNAETKTQYQMNQEGVKTDALSFTTDRRYALSVRATF